MKKTIAIVAAVTMTAGSAFALPTNTPTKVINSDLESQANADVTNTATKGAKVISGIRAKFNQIKDSKITNTINKDVTNNAEGQVTDQDFNPTPVINSGVYFENKNGKPRNVEINNTIDNTLTNTTKDGSYINAGILGVGDMRLQDAKISNSVKGKNGNINISRNRSIINSGITLTRADIQSVGMSNTQADVENRAANKAIITSGITADDAKVVGGGKNKEKIINIVKNSKNTAENKAVVNTGIAMENSYLNVSTGKVVNELSGSNNFANAKGENTYINAGINLNEIKSNAKLIENKMAGSSQNYARGKSKIHSGITVSSVEKITQTPSVTPSINIIDSNSTIKNSSRRGTTTNNNAQGESTIVSGIDIS